MLESIFPLPIFPEGSLAGSVITTVWVGVFVMAFFNLRYGWLLSGLVVPGYLVPILILKPWSAALIVFEGALTYLIVYIFSEKAWRLGLWSSLFGRDRFFAIVLVSVAVRIAFDGAIIPSLDEYLKKLGLSETDLRNDLQSFGLIIIALTANQFWKPGLSRGLFTLGVGIAVTWLIVRFVLMEYTNFSISNIGYMYEAAAQSILASPKSYIVLLTAAFIASRFNLLYGWDFNGILLPALLALQWYQPSKILFTFAEAYVILTFARYLVGTSLFANMNIEGARKILFLFNISFLYRYLAGWFVPIFFPDTKVTDTFGFGYLLSTLLALKMFDKGAAVQMTRATIQASGTAVIIATIIGFAIQLLNREDQPSFAPEFVLSAQTASPDISLEQQMRDDAILYYQARSLGQMPRPYPHEIRTFRQAIYQLANEPIQAENKAIGALDSLGFQVTTFDQRYLYIREKEPIRGWGSFVIDRQAESELILEWPRASNERVRPDDALLLMTTLGAKGLSLATARSEINADNSSDMLLARESIFTAFRKGMRSDQILQVRSRALHGDERDKPTLWVKRALPDGLNVRVLTELFDGLQTIWGAPKFQNAARESTLSGIAELMVTRRDLRQAIIAREGLSSVQQLKTVQRIDGYLAEWVFETPGRFAERGSNRYRPPGTDELLYLDEEVISPLLAEAPLLKDAPDRETRLAVLNRAASTVGYNLVHLIQATTNEEYVLLSETAEDSKRFWGVLIVRLGPARPIHVGVPYPQSEPGSGELALTLFEQLGARALTIATAHRHANPNALADVLLPESDSLLTLANQTFLEAHNNGGSHTLLVRGYFFNDPAFALDVDAVLLPDRYPAGPQSNYIFKHLKDLGLNLAYANTQPSLATSTLTNNPIAQQVQIWPSAEFSLIRLSPSVRSSFKRYTSNRVEQRLFAAVGIEERNIALKTLIQSHQSSPPKRPLPAEMIEALKSYQHAADVVALYRLTRRWPQYRFERVLDRENLNSYIAVYDPSERLAGIWTINPLRLNQGQAVALSEANPEIISSFMRDSSAWLIFAPSE